MLIDLFTNAKKKQPRCPSIGEQINCDDPRMEYYSAIKRNELSVQHMKKNETGLLSYTIY